MTTRWRRWAAAGVALAVMGTAAAAWLPGFLKGQIEGHAGAWLGRAVSVQSVELHPLSLAATLHGLAVAGAAGDAVAAPQLSVDRIRVDGSVASLWRLAPVVEGIEVDGPRLRVARHADGDWDVGDLVERLRGDPDAPAAQRDEPPRIALYNIAVRSGSFDLVDAAAGRRHEVRSIDLGVPFVSTLPADIAVTVQPRLSAVLDGSIVETAGEALPFSPERASTLRIDVEGLELDRLWAYLPRDLPVRPAGGRLDAALTLRFAHPPGATPVVALAGRVVVAGPELFTATGVPLAGWRELVLEIGDARPLERRVGLQRVAIERPEIDLRRAADGAIEWVTLAQRVVQRTRAARPSPAGGSEGGAGWNFALDRLELSDARLRWRDASTQPQAAVDATVRRLEAGALRWPLESPMPFSVSATLAAAGVPAGDLRLTGALSSGGARLRAEVDGLQLGVAAPYLATHVTVDVAGRAQAVAGVEVAFDGAPLRRIDLETLRVDDLRVLEHDDSSVSPPAHAGAMPRSAAVEVPRLDVRDAAVDLVARRADVGSVRVQRPSVALRRGADGQVSAVTWLRRAARGESLTGAAPDAWTAPLTAGIAAAAAAAGSARAPGATPWSAAVGRLQVDAGRVRWLDRSSALPGDAPVQAELRDLRLTVRRFAWAPAAKAPPAAASFEMAAMLPHPDDDGVGRVTARGRLSPLPLQVQADLDVESLPVHAFVPYLADRLPVELRRAEAGFRGGVELGLRDGGLALAARGDARLTDLRVLARADDGAATAGDELLAWQSLTLQPLAVRIAPGTRPAIEIGEVFLSDFHSQLVITEQGRFNLRDIGPRPAPAGTISPGTEATGAQADAAPAASAAGPIAGVAQPWPLDLSVQSVRFTRGRVDFRDRFIRPSYAAELTELEGRLGRFSSTERSMATLEVTGRAAGTAQLEIRGALNPTADPLALDVAARATNLELAPLSPYAGKYAGYAIERGKLSLDVAYRVDPDGRLQARNQIVLNQLTFGEKIESPDATTLPVRLAVALLSDRHGVIDIDLPISGSINDPQFSVFGLVVKVIVNLIGKALTAPFALLSGGGEELSHVDFEPGTARLAPSGGGVVDRVAKALQDRPSLRLTVTGSADAAIEADAMRRVALESRLAAEQRRRSTRGGASADAPLPPPTPEEREGLVRRLYADAPLPDKPRNALRMVKDIPVPEMEARLLAAMPADAERARELGLQRGLAVRDLLVARGLGAERIFLAAPRVRGEGRSGTADATDAGWTPRADLSLELP